MNGSIHREPSTKALVLVSCMLLCAVSPMMATWCDDGSDSYAVADDTFTYVSLGDSMVNGFGMTGYYNSNNENTYGFMIDVEPTYPHMMAKYLREIMPGIDVEHLQLATSSMRSSELRAILDPSFTGDSGTHEFMQDSNGTVKKMISTLPSGYDRNLDGVRAYYTDSLSKADLVTYQFHYDIGFITSNTLSKLIDDSVNLMPLDLSIYIDKEYLEFFENTKIQITGMLKERLSSTGMDDETFDTLERYTDRVIDGLSYIVVSYCANFDANMELMLGLNPDVRILAIDNYNTFIDMNLMYGEYSIPISSIYDLFLDILNMYTKYMSPYSEKVYHVSLDQNPDLFIDEFKDNTNGNYISNDAKNVMMAVLQGHTTVNPNGYVEYDLLDDYTINPDSRPVELFMDFVKGNVKKNHNNLSEFMHYVFNTTVIDARLILEPSFDMETEINKLTEKMLRVIIDMDNIYIPFDPSDLSSITLDNIRNMKFDGIGYIMQPNATVTFDEATGSCTVSCINGSETFSKVELALLRMNFYVLKTSAVMTHPCEKGHTQIFNEMKDRIEERDILRSDTVDEPSIFSLLFEDPLPVYGELDASPKSNGTLLNLGGITSGYGSDGTYPAIVAEALGLRMSSIQVPSDARVDDVNYLIGGTERHDAYTDSIMEKYYSNLGMNTSDIQKMYKDAVEGSDTILVSLGFNNLLYPLIQAEKLLMGGTSYDYDISSFSIITEELYADYMMIREHLDNVVTGMFGDDQKIMDTYDKTIKMAESAIYSSLGYIDNYFELVGKLHELNPDAKIICIGNYNILDGFMFSGTIDVNIGLICSKIIGLFNSYNGYMLFQCEGVTYIDILDVHVNETDFTITKDMDEEDLTSALNLCMLSGAEHQKIAERILSVCDTSSNKNGHNTILIVGGSVAAAIIGIIAVISTRRH